MNRTTAKKWFAFLLGLLALMAFVGLLHWATPHLGGQVGLLISENREKGFEVYAYFYSEVGELSDFLDDESGRYGAAAFRRMQPNSKMSKRDPKD
jgi:hypothetical protein